MSPACAHHTQTGDVGKGEIKQTLNSGATPLPRLRAKLQIASVRLAAAFAPPFARGLLARVRNLRCALLAHAFSPKRFVLFAILHVSSRHLSSPPLEKSGASRMPAQRRQPTNALAIV
jgi:hypothetical protein